MSENENTETTSWLSTWLASLGMSQTWANIIATAVISAATAVFALMQTSCDLASVASITSDSGTTVITGSDGSQAVFSSDGFTWTQITPTVGTVEVEQEDAK